MAAISAWVLVTSLIIGGLWIGGAIYTQTKVAVAVPNSMSGAFYLFEYDISDELVVDCNQENGNWVITLSLKEKYEGDLADKPVHMWEWEIYVGNRRYF